MSAGWHSRVYVVLLLAFMAVLAGVSAHRESVTIDEVAHIAAGVSYLQKLDMRMNEEHPPLAKVVAAIPLVARGVHADYTSTAWTFSEKILNQFLGEWSFGNSFLMHWNAPVSTLWWARIPMLLVTLLLGVALYSCGASLGENTWSGLLCLSAFATMPVFLAFGPLVITDIIVALFWILAVWQMPTMWRSPAWGDKLKFALFLAGAFLSKFSSGLILFVFPVVAWSVRFRPLPGQPVGPAELRSWRRAAWRNAAQSLFLAAIFVYLVYLILSWNESTESFSLIHFPASPFFRRALMPVWLYLRGILLFAVSAGSRPTFILGHAYPHGVWFYFPVLFLLKSPFPFLLLLLLAAGFAVWMKFPHASEFSVIPPAMHLHWRCLSISLLIYTAACLLSRLDISIRHFSIPLALIILLLAPLPRMLEFARQRNLMLGQAGTWATIVLVISAFIVAVNAFPNFFPFVNVLRMGRPSYLLFSDSNLDWDQSLPRVEKFVTQHGIKRLLLDPYSFSETQAYVPEGELWNCQQPSAADAGQWAMVSANLIADGSNCRWLFRYLHFEIAGGSMYAFRLPDVIPAAGDVGGPPLPKDYRYFGGMAFQGGDIRNIFLAGVRDPQQLEPTMNRMKEEMKRYQNNKR